MVKRFGFPSCLTCHTMESHKQSQGRSGSPSILMHCHSNVILAPAHPFYYTATWTLSWRSALFFQKSFCKDADLHGDFIIPMVPSYLFSLHRLVFSGFFPSAEDVNRTWFWQPNDFATNGNNPTTSNSVPCVISSPPKSASPSTRKRSTKHLPWIHFKSTIYGEALKKQHHVFQLKHRVCHQRFT